MFLPEPLSPKKPRKTTIVYPLTSGGLVPDGADGRWDEGCVANCVYTDIIYKSCLLCLLRWGLLHSITLRCTSPLLDLLVQDPRLHRFHFCHLDGNPGKYIGMRGGDGNPSALAEPLSFRTCAAFISVSIRACAAGRAVCPSIIVRISPRSASDNSGDKGRAACSLCPRLGSHQTHIKHVGVAPSPRFLGASHQARFRLTRQEFVHRLL